MEHHDERPLTELEALRAPARSPEQRRHARERILAAAEPLLARRRAPTTSLEILAAWARPGLIAASVALLVFAAALRFGQQTPEPVRLDEVLASGEAGQVPAFLVAINEPDADAVVAATLLENGNGRQVNGGLEERR
ncbi:MAG TPA: hypothetical protein VLC48_05350 [Gemmatimonadota bacterium]|nr:hypothetical protein [Gemmatimonadota bacterium]